MNNNIKIGDYVMAHKDIRILLHSPFPRTIKIDKMYKVVDISIEYIWLEGLGYRYLKRRFKKVNQLVGILLENNA